jgi:hypothetical protein
MSSTHNLHGAISASIGLGNIKAGRPGSRTLDTSMPMELLGASPGISIIDPSTVLTRLWYFDGKFLRADGFRRDQEYVRSLVALSNQTVGSGIAHGFDVRLAKSDRIRVEGGLGLAPSGRVVYLPSDTQLSIAELISRSIGGFDPASAPTPGTADFSRCSPDESLDPDLPVPPRPLYVLTVAAAEALCGEEERFGKLCEDACATDTDRSVAVEGVRFRVRELVLKLPTSRVVPFTGLHLRSRVASAFYREEQRRVPSMISGAGLRTPVWCAGADGIGGEEIPLAVFDRSGAVTTFVDMWTARRELVETTPHRYWQWRFAARPLDVFLAQVLQFQCQLVSIGTDGDADETDPCAEERRALQEVEAVLGTLSEVPPAVGVRPGANALAAPAAASINAIPAVLIARLGELQTLVAGALAGNQVSPSGSLLIDHGIVETAAAGYLPVEPSKDVRAQVRAFMGAGVDLRFCAVRPDFVPEAFQEAQHMERISLTKGLDDRGQLEEVDVLVPNGTFETTPRVSDAFEGRVRVLPAASAGTVAATGSALALRAVGRDQVSDGWSWTVAAFGEAPQRLGVTDLAAAVLRDAGGPTTANIGDGVVRVHIDEDATHARALADPGLLLRLNREGANARSRRERVVTRATIDTDTVIGDLAVAPEERRPVAGWFDVETADALDRLPVGGRTSIRLRAITYSRASTSPVLMDAQIEGAAIVTSRQSVPIGAGADGTTVFVTRVQGVVDPLIIVGGEVTDTAPSPLNDLILEWRISARPTRTRVMSVTATRRGGSMIGKFTETTGGDRHIKGTIGTAREAPSRVNSGPFTTLVDVNAGRESRRLADVELDEAPGALDVGAPGRDLGNAVIDVIAGELAARRRENGFAELARIRLFPAPADPTGHIRAHTDWVMFHRRRTKQCSAVERPTPVAVRRFRWYHATLGADRQDLATLTSITGSLTSVATGGANSFARVFARLDTLGFEPLTIVEFPADGTDLRSSTVALRTAWSTAPRGERMAVAVIATAGVGDGEVVNLGRLNTATGSVGDLIDIVKTRTRVVTEIPPDVQSAGLDGVVMTVGIERPPTVTACAHVFRMERAAFNRLMPALRNLRTLDEIRGLLTQLEVPDPIVAHFTDDAIGNGDEIRAWWPGRSVVSTVIAFDRSIVGDATQVTRWMEPRTAALRAFIPVGELRRPEAVEVDLGGCHAIYFIQEVGVN